MIPADALKTKLEEKDGVFLTRPFSEEEIK